MSKTPERKSEPGAEAAEPSPGESGSERRTTSIDQRRKRTDEIDAEVQALVEAEREQRNTKTARLRAARLAAEKK
jgi:hypothetical protein